MERFRITGKTRLSGTCRAEGAKNAILPMLAAAVMTGDRVVIRDCPALKDIANMLAILRKLGCGAFRENGCAVVDAGSVSSWEMPEELSKTLRSSIFLLGPLIARFRRACAAYPGGCDIGLRPIDLHLKGLMALGVRIEEKGGRICCDGTRLKGANVYLDFPSVGATENIMMAAVLADGRTRIINAAREPEIRDLQMFINAMGGRVRGGGTDCVVIDGVEALHGAAYTPMPDRIAAGTYLAACGATRGEITVENAPTEAMGSVIDKLRRCGCDLDVLDGRIHMDASGKKLSPLEISTQVYPGFPTDLQAQFMALACTIEGTSLIEENLFENRFGHAAQLRRMGADLTVRGQMALVRASSLSGALVRACDLRGGAALVIAAMAAEGVTEVENCGMIDRGYARLEDTLSELGAQIVRLRE